MDNRFENLPSDFESDLMTIAARLHSNHAVVMVGAGFSKNANASYPDWQALGDIFYSTLHPGENKPSGNYLNIMDLADEVAASKGRATLDEIVKKRIKDGTLPPSKLHEDLLSLPWRDVFTTNYDTLLEATLPRLIGRRYSVVVKANQLANANAPRIIKLHGSFPACTPFVLTTEDYRTYSETHAPFVNTVRQAFLEKTFCLIGFSGDDPNFLNWAGWIRDYLGNYGQPIFLITMSESSSSKMALLSSRGIRVVPLSKFNGIPTDGYVQGYKALFDYLYAKGANPQPLTGLFNVKLTGLLIGDVRVLESVWRKERESYKGAMSVSPEVRALLFMSIRGKEHFFNDLAKTTEYALGTRFCFEYLWRIDKALRYVLLPVVHYMSILLEYWAGEERKGCISDRKLAELNLSVDEICAIGCRLLKSYREMAEFGGWVKTSMLLERLLSRASNETKNEFKYQKVLFAMFHFSINGMRSELLKWNPDASDPLALARCGILYASIKDWGNARRCLSDALSSVRKVSSFTEDNRLLGMESAIIANWKWVEENSEGLNANQKLLQTLRGRQLELRGRGCDITEDIQYFERFFSALAKPSSYEEVKDSYDLDTRSKVVTYTTIVENGYSLFTFVEQLGLPLCILGEGAMKRVLQETVHIFPILALSYLCYFGNASFAQDVLTRQAFADMDLGFAEGTLILSIECVKDLLSSGGNGINASMIQVHIQLLARLLCCRISDKARRIVVDWYKDLLSRPEQIPVGTDLNEFSKLLVRTTSFELLPYLVKVLAGIAPSRIIMAGPLPMISGNPLEYVISLIEDESLKPQIQKIFSEFSLISDEWAHLINGIRSNEKWIKVWTLATVVLYLRLGLLDSVQIDEFKDAIAFDISGKFNPFVGNFYESITVDIFSMSDKGYKEWYIEKIFSGEWFESSVFNEGVAISHGRSRSTHNVGVALARFPELFGPKTVERFIARIKSEWEICKNLISRQDALNPNYGDGSPSLSVEGFDRARNLANLLAKLSTHVDADQEKNCSELLESICQEQAPCMAALASLGDDEYKCSLLVNAIPARLHSHIQSVELDSIEALALLLGSSSAKVFELAQSVALNAIGWASPLECGLVECIMNAVCRRASVSLTFQHVLFNMIARWSMSIGLVVENNISAEGKVRAIIALGRILANLMQHTQLNDYRKAAVAHMKKSFADPLPYVEVYRAWENIPA